MNRCRCEEREHLALDGNCRFCEDNKEPKDSDIYAIAARVKNLARNDGGSLTGVGEAMCNLYVHVIKSFYEFSESLPEDKKTELQDLIRKNEAFPGLLIQLTRKK